MRTKALILTAAFVAAGVASTMAQVYSANAVGYVNLTLVPGFTIVANPLNGTNNHLNTILPLGDPGTDTTIYRFKAGIQNYGDAITYYGAEIGWFTTDPEAETGFMVIPPGEGFFIQNVKPAALNVTFVGEVPQGALSNPVVGNGKFSIMASQVPQALPLGTAGTANTLEFPAATDDTVYIFDSGIQNYKESYTYYGEGVGWFSVNPDDPGPQGPVIPVATGFFVQKIGPDVNWVRNFSVN
jgi:hypothetical protein